MIHIIDIIDQSVWTLCAGVAATAIRGKLLPLISNNSVNQSYPIAEMKHLNKIKVPTLCKMLR